MIEFDGADKLITLDPGDTSVSVADIYSRWKDWILENGNLAYLPAFRIVGGDTLTTELLAGIYYFLRNDYGWRIKPPEEDITIYLTGNLVPQDIGTAMIIPTTGDFTAAIIGIQPITQVVLTGGSALTVEDIWDIDPASNTNPDSIMTKIRKNLPK